MNKYMDIETILKLTGSYDWNEKIIISKTDTGYEVNGFEFITVKAACDFIESYYKVSVFSKSVKVGARVIKASAKEGVKLAATGLWRIGKTMETMGAAIKKGANKF